MLSTAGGWKQIMRLNFGTLEKIKEAIWARYLFRRCTSVGSLTRAQGRVIVSNRGILRIGDRVRFRATHVPIELGVLQKGELIIGDHTFINSGVSIGVQKLVRIGKNVAIGNYSLILDSDFHVPGDHTRWPEAKPVIIEDDVWLASRVTILKGVTIGQGAVVAAGAVVTKDVAPYTLVGGVPARLIRHLDSKQHTPEPIA
jgi:acetyltransferase-like isoleucine patch superfamily enzyme